jgi:cephalosporin-C deacetylase
MVQNDVALRQYFDALLAEAQGDEPGLTKVPEPAFSDGRVSIARLSYMSAKGVVIAGWLAEPREELRKGAIIQFPAYGEVLFPPLQFAALGLTAMSVSVRGHQGSSAQVNPGFPGLLTEGLPDASTYIYRDMVIDCLRGLAELSELTKGTLPIVATGRSQGAALSLILAALSSSVRAVAAEVPWLCDIEAAMQETDSFPYRELRGWLQNHPEHQEQTRATLRLFDTCSHASAIRCPVLLGIGTEDPVSPITATRRLASVLPHATVVEYQGAGHEGGGLKHRELQSNWIREQIGA